MNNEDEENQAVLTSIKECLDQKNRHELSREETIEFISRPIFMGHPMPLPAKSRGRKPTRTQYDLAYERRKGMYQRLVRLPKLQLGNGYMPKKEILKIASKIPMKCKRATAVKQKLDLLGLPSPDISKIRAFLRKNNL